ncbi:MAG: hypothetical protein IPK74_13525 [Deltaproteobacteria bacterium]|nr:hypothetical protein [Deltaproteobacteria bacterium]
MVKTSFTDADLIRAMDWLCERADKLGLPLVINLSLGGHTDGHDGYDALSQHVDESPARAASWWCRPATRGRRRHPCDARLQRHRAALGLRGAAGAVTQQRRPERA